MSRHFIILANDRLRAVAHEYIDKARPMSRIEFKGPKRSTDQNAKMWACLSDIARQLKWHGLTMPADDWKLMFLDALRRAHNEELRIVPNLDGTGFVNLSSSSSDLSKEEMGDLITIILQFGDAHGVVFTEPRDEYPHIVHSEATDSADQDMTVDDQVSEETAPVVSSEATKPVSTTPDPEIIRDGGSAARDGQGRTPPEGLDEFQRKVWFDAYDNAMEAEAGVSA